ncbi:MAG: adenylate/guanylate cyclase domain-containing protein [Acetobacteraceae bacterium]
MRRPRPGGNVMVGPPASVKAARGRRANTDQFSRRLAAIVFIDIVGYSILMAQHETATYARWMTLLHEIIHPELARHRGSFIKSTGDGLLAEFPSALDALNWARQTQRAVTQAPGTTAAQGNDDPPPPISLRIAVHLGDVFTDASNDIYGDGVNVAARLQEFAAPGGIVLSEAVHDLVRGHLAFPAHDLGLLHLKNFEHPVRAFMVNPLATTQTAPTLQGQHAIPSIAVLPLQNLSGDPSEGYFCEGIVEDIVSSLAGLRDILVISRGSTLGLARQNADLREIGRALGVRYVLTGSVRRSPTRVRVSVQLADAVTGSGIWAHTADALLHDLFDQQDHVVEAIVAGIAPHIRRYELRRALRKHPESFTAYDLTLQAIELINLLDRATFERARDLLKRAIDEDPLFALPRAWAAHWHGINIGQGWSTDRAADIASAVEMSQRAIGLDRDNAFALAVHAHLRAYLFHDYATALAGFERALASCPNSAFAWCLSAATLSYVGRAEDAVRNLERGLRLSPFDPELYYYYNIGAWARYALGAYEDALKWARMSATENPRFTANFRVMAAIQHALGQTEAARNTTAEMLRLEPDFSLARYLATRQPFRDPAVSDRFIAVLRDLDLPP